MAAMARWCFLRRAWVLVAWLALLVILGVTGRAAGSAYSNTLTLPGTGSTTALQLLEQAFPGHAGDQDSIVWRASPGSVRTPAVRARITAMLGKVAAAPAVASVISPYSAAGAAQVSRNGQIAYATVVFDAQAANLPVADVNHVISIAEAARAPGLQVELGGQAVETALRPSIGISAVIGLVAAAVVLFIAFGSLLAMLLPLIIAIAALVSGLMTVGLLSHAVSIPSIGPTVATLIGLGVGIDYALFVVTRHRNNIKAGMSPQDAAVLALNTSGRAVLFAGTTVCIAVLGMLVLNVTYVSGLGISSAITVLFTMAAAVTLLPALLGLLGMRVLSRRERRRLAADGPTEPGTAGWWARLAAFVQRHPARLATATAAVMLVLAIPVLSLRLGSSDAANDPSSYTTRHAYDLLAEGFGPGFNGPLQLVATTGTPADAAALDRLAATLKTVPGVAAVSAPIPGKDAALISVIPSSSPEAQATSDLISRLRGSVIPAAEHGTTMRVYVGGVTAIFGDFATVIGHKLPLFIAAIIGLGFLLLLLAFRSLLVPATAALMNLLAAGAAFGVVIAIFQFGWGLRILNLGQSGPVESFLPVLMLSVLFGLSMDYEVFLVSRIREEWAATGDNRQAVITGQATTGRVIIAAATIMICVFSAFILTGQQVIGEFGLGLAAAVLLDAFLLRTLLVPALMHLAGRANWWLPGWLDRALPHLSIEPATPPAAQTVALDPFGAAHQLRQTGKAGSRE
ncbi:MAG: MMPL family transporter [Streptosporangiaceae bacterium]